MSHQLRSLARRRPRRNRRRLLHVESLEPRIVLSSCAGAPVGAPDDVYGSLAGTIASAGDTASCDLGTVGYTLNGGTIRIGFHVVGTGGFDPATVQITGGPASTVYQNANSGGGSESVILAELGADVYTLTVSGEGGSTGNFEMQIFLAGDVDGNRAADAADRSPLLATYGKSTGSPRFNVAADANRDGSITSFDYIQWRRNLGDVAEGDPVFTSAPVTSATVDVVYTYDVTATSDPGEVLTITDTTLPAWLSLTNHGDGTATLTGTPGAGDLGANAVGLLVTDPMGATDSQDFSITVSADTPPVATNDVVNSGATGNVQMSSNGAGVTINGVVGGNVLGNDTGGGLTAVAGGSSSTNGGSVNMSANGDFTYNPAPGFEGTDTFTYTVQNSAGSDVGTVSIDVSDMIWFIDAAAPGGGDGRLTDPFNCLVGAGCFDPAAADSAGDSIFLADGTYNAGLTLLNNQILIGEGASGTLEAATGITAAPGSDALPALNGTNPILSTVSGDGIMLGSGNTIRGLTVGNTAGSGISGSSFGTLTVSETTINGNGQALDLDSGTLSVTFDSLSSSGGTDGININNVSGSLTVSGSTSVSTAASDGIVISNSGGASFDFGLTSVGSFGNGIDIAGNNAGAFFAFDSLFVVNQSGTGFWADNSGTVNINTTGASVDSTGGPALDITNTIGQTNGANDWTFGSLTSLNSPTDGIVFQNVGQSISLSNINIDNAAHEGIELNNVTGATNTITGGSIDGAATDRDGIFLSGVTGVTTIQGTGAGTPFDITNIGTGTGTGHNGIHSLNSGDLTVQFVNIDDVGQSGDEHGISIVDPISGDRTISITNSTFANIGETETQAGNAIDLEATTAAGYTGTLDIDITNNDINGNGVDFNTADIGVNLDFAAPANGTLDANISSNDIDGVQTGIAVIVQGAAGSGVNGRNIIQINDNFGDDFDNNGIELDVLPDTNGVNSSNTRAVISGNVLNAITNYTGSGHDPDEAIEVEMRGDAGSPALSIDITNNTIDSVSFATDERWDGNGITVGTAGSDVAFAPTITADIHGNNVDKVEDAGILLKADESATVSFRVTSNTLSADTDGMELDTEADPYTLQTFFSSNTASAWDLEENSNAGSTWELGVTAPNGSIGSTFTTPANNATLEALLSGEGNTGVAGAFQDVATIDVVDEATISGANLLAAADLAGPTTSVSPLTQGDLNRVASTAIDLWASSGISAAQHESLDQVRFEPFNLPAGHLGNSLPGIVEIDVDAAGRGWSLDPIVGGTRVDLLTVVMHELGHVLGLGDTDHDGHDLMSGSLDVGNRRLPLFQGSRSSATLGSVASGAADQLFDLQGTSLTGVDLGSSLNLGRLGLESGRLLSTKRLAERRASSSREARDRDDDELNVDGQTDLLDQLAANLAAAGR